MSKLFKAYVSQEHFYENIWNARGFRAHLEALAIEAGYVPLPYSDRRPPKAIAQRQGNAVMELLIEVEGGEASN